MSLTCKLREVFFIHFKEVSLTRERVFFVNFICLISYCSLSNCIFRSLVGIRSCIWGDSETENEILFGFFVMFLQLCCHFLDDMFLLLSRSFWAPDEKGNHPILIAWFLLRDSYCVILTAVQLRIWLWGRPFLKLLKGGLLVWEFFSQTSGNRILFLTYHSARFFSSIYAVKYIFFFVGFFFCQLFPCNNFPPQNQAAGYFLLKLPIFEWH